MEIVEYNNSDDVWVKFKGYDKKIHAQWHDFQKGNIRHPYDKSIYGVGYIGEGKYRVSNNGKHSPQYIKWYGIMERCYSDKLKKRHQTYMCCTIAEEWLNFQNFAKWYDENNYEVVGEQMHLDKDILIKGNKIYSPDTCVFVPQRINALFIKNNVNRGNQPLGVSYYEPLGKYVAQYQGGNRKLIRLGYYSTPKEAFLAYKSAKESYIKQVAENYKYKIPINLYEAMMNYQVEITD